MAKSEKRDNDDAKDHAAALTVFERHQLAPAMRGRILEMDPKFEQRTAEEQEEIVLLLVDQAQKTTEGVRSRFPLIQVRHAGAKSFELPKTAGQSEGEIVREFEGVVVDQYITKAYWQNPMGGGSGSPPDCASLNALTPYTRDPISADCVTCPYNKFGSGVDRDGNPTRGKRCRDQKRAIVKLDGHELT
jgi:hypothetical protein